MKRCLAFYFLLGSTILLIILAIAENPATPGFQIEVKTTQTYKLPNGNEIHGEIDLASRPEGNYKS